VDFTDPQISLVNADLTGLPPTIVFYGEYEASPKTAHSSASDSPTSRSPPRPTRCPKGSTRSSWARGRVPEVDEAVGQMRQWLRRHLGA
jgi:monoterpene epsilon-lactone hydrolase